MARILAPKISKTKIFGGKKYEFFEGYNTKSIADNILKQVKRQRLARISKIYYTNMYGKKAPYYLIYTRDK